MTLQPCVSPIRDPRLQQHFSNIQGHDRLLGALGVLPRDLTGLLRPRPDMIGVPEAHQKLFGKETQALLAQLRATILSASRDIFCEYAPRDSWLFSPGNNSVA